MKKKILIGYLVMISTVYSAQLELKGGYEFWREINNKTSKFDQGWSLGGELLFNSLNLPLDYGIGMEWKSKFSGGGKDSSLGEVKSNAYPIYLTAKYDLYKDIYAVGRIGGTIYDDKNVDDGFYGAVGLGKKTGKWNIEILYENMDIGQTSHLYSGEKVGVASIKFGYRFGENSRGGVERKIENKQRMEEYAKLKAEILIKEEKKETFNSIIISTDYLANIEKTDVLNEKILNKIAADLKEKTGILKIKGYTDNSGTEKYNKELSKKRAEKVADQIKNKLKDNEKTGVINNKTNILIITEGHGETSYIINNSTPENRKRNRRVVIEFFEEIK